MTNTICGIRSLGSIGIMIEAIAFLLCFSDIEKDNGIFDLTTQAEYVFQTVNNAEDEECYWVTIKEQ